MLTQCTAKKMFQRANSLSMCWEDWKFDVPKETFFLFKHKASEITFLHLEDSVMFVALMKPEYRWKEDNFVWS